jgi:hypothetical protein
MTSPFSRALLLILALASLPAARLAATPEEEETTPYYGDWENAQGDKLQITSDGIQVNKEKAVGYDDITEDSDGTFFVLQLKGDSPYFEGKFLRLTFGKDPDRFTMSIYKTLPDALKKENEVKKIEWSAPAPAPTEEEETEKDKDKENEQDQDKDKENEAPLSPIFDLRLIKWAPHSDPRAIQHMRINHRGAHILVT